MPFHFCMDEVRALVSLMGFLPAVGLLVRLAVLRWRGRS